MKRLIVGGVGVIMAFALILVMSTEAAVDFLWSRPSSNSYTGSITWAVNAQPALTLEEKQELEQKMNRANVTVGVFKVAIAASKELSDAEKFGILDKVRGRSFLALEHIELYVPVSAVELKRSLASKINTTVYTVGKILPGDRCNSMVFDGNKVVSSVVFKPAKDAPQELDAHFFVIGRDQKVMVQPLICNNLCFGYVRLTMIQTTTRSSASAQASAGVVGGAPTTWNLIVTYWDGKTNGQIRMHPTAGFNSRDMGLQLRQARMRKEIEHVKGCKPAQLEFLDVDFEKARGTEVFVNGKPFRLPQNFSAKQNAIDMMVCDGEGIFAVDFDKDSPRNWFTKRSAVVAHVPRDSGALFYPPDRALYTCSEATSGLCGQIVKAGDVGELYTRFTSEKNSYMHFTFK